jgi:hypothetical protein
MQTQARITPKHTHYRIECPTTGLCVRLHAEPAPADEAPKITAQLAPGSVATWFTTWRQAAAVFARYLPGQSLEIVRVDV